MTIQEIKDKLKKTATIFQTGGVRPSDELSVNWIGKVTWGLEGELIPTDKDGMEMLPLATLFLGDLEGVPKSLENIYLCTAFVSRNILDHLMDMEGYYTVRLYTKDDKLVPLSFVNTEIKAFPLIPKTVDNDFPTWDGAGIPFDIEDEIIRLEEEEDIDYFEDIKEDDYPMHKVGGYPAYIQPGGWDMDLYDFVFQISSDEKAKLNIVHGGSFYFFYSQKEQKWQLQCDFY